jgi:hypothetical protein
MGIHLPSASACMCARATAAAYWGYLRGSARAKSGDRSHLLSAQRMYSRWAGADSGAEAPYAGASFTQYLLHPSESSNQGGGGSLFAQPRRTSATPTSPSATHCPPTSASLAGGRTKTGDSLTALQPSFEWGSTSFVIK